MIDNPDQLTIRECLELAHAVLGEHVASGYNLLLYAAVYERLGKALYGSVRWDFIRGNDMPAKLNGVQL